MLKNKNTVYLLVPLNIAVWGFFAYRFWSAYYEADPAQIPEQVQTSMLEDRKDSVIYQLEMNYKDPFLKEASRSLVSQTLQKSPAAQAPVPRQAKAETKAAPVATIVPKDLPVIRYIGLIKNTTKGSAAALITLNGQSRLIKPNEKTGGLVFKSFTKDSLVALYGKELIVVRK